MMPPANSINGDYRLQSDIVDAATRSRMMAGIRSRDTKPEMLVRRGLHRRGFRFRLHGRKMPGRPDLVLPRYRAAVFVHGCFWHGHDCPPFKWPRAREMFWREKIIGNQARDRKAVEALGRAGWRVLTVWECAFRNKDEAARENALDQIATWLKQGDAQAELLGDEHSCRLSH
jgi:DNA mismatch endonuclease (patch repair protein)